MTAAPVGQMAGKVRATLENLQLAPEDAAVAALAVQYGETIDRAAELAEAAARVPYDPDTAAEVAKLRKRVEAHQVMVDVGPKLLAVLDALAATPRARAQAGRPAPPAGVASKLAMLRGGPA